MSVPDGFGPLVDAGWLLDNLASVRVVDVRWYLDGRSGLEAYRTGHIPGAVWADIDDDLSSAGDPIAGRHPLPTPEHFAAALSRLGIGNDDVVVVYDDASGSIAARLWWMLDALDVRAAVLDGGLAAWRGELERVDARPAPASFTPASWPARRFVDADAVDALRERDPLLDARSFGRFTGDEPSLDLHPGHIPGARSAPWTENVDPDTGRLLPAEVLRRRFAALGVEEGSRVVTTCGSGVTACHDLLALRVAGFDDASLFPGSWSGWSSDPDRPIALGAD